ncbi:MAG: hypothetical protein JWP74_2259 [Marmoricola sp.]|nr:hypothetical protein [Marmoricola sp.]
MTSRGPALRALLGVLAAGAVLAGSSTAIDPASSASLPPTLTPVVGVARTVQPAFFGVNGARIISAPNASEWHDPVFTQAVAALAPGYLRIQGGTTSQWIDWRTGLFDQSANSPYVGANAGRRPILMSDWADLLRATGAQPVYDLNVTTSTPADQVAMLHEAQRLGMPVTHLELGNELYIGDKTYKALYPTGADYARAMNHWIDVLRTSFPGVQIAVSAADTSSSLFSAFYGKRYTSWNKLLYAGIRGADAVALHPYWFPTPADGTTASAGSGLAAWKALSTKVIAQVPADLHVWLTEYNQMDVPFTEVGVPSGLLPGAKQTWAVGLSLAAFSLQALADPRVTMAVVHSALNGEPTAAATQSGGNMEVHALLADGSGGSTLFGRTAENDSLTPLFDAVRDQGSGPVEVRLLTVASAPKVTTSLWSPTGVSTVSGVTGAWIGDRLALVNLSSSAVRITLPSAGPWSATVQTAPPRTRPAFNPGDTVGSSTATVSATILLPAYSEALLSQR